MYIHYMYFFLKLRVIQMQINKIHQILWSNISNKNNNLFQSLWEIGSALCAVIAYLSLCAANRVGYAFIGCNFIESRFSGKVMVRCFIIPHSFMLNI